MRLAANAPPPPTVVATSLSARSTTWRGSSTKPAWMVSQRACRSLASSPGNSWRGCVGISPPRVGCRRTFPAKVVSDGRASSGFPLLAQRWPTSSTPVPRRGSFGVVCRLGSWLFLGLGCVVDRSGLCSGARRRWFGFADQFVEQGPEVDRDREGPRSLRRLARGAPRCRERRDSFAPPRGGPPKGRPIAARNRRRATAGSHHLADQLVGLADGRLWVVDEQRLNPRHRVAYRSRSLAVSGRMENVSHLFLALLQFPLGSAGVRCSPRSRGCIPVRNSWRRRSVRRVRKNKTMAMAIAKTMTAKMIAEVVSMTSFLRSEEKRSVYC